MVKVLIIESERGWGSKVDEVKEFDTKLEAIEFCNEYNKENNEETVPDWYMCARLENEYTDDQAVIVFDTLNGTIIENE